MARVSLAVAFFVIIGALHADTAPPIGILRGDLLEWNGSQNSGEFSVRASGNAVYVCEYDRFSYIERNGQRATPESFKSGDHLEIVSDRRRDSAKCYARTVRVVEEQRAAVVNPGYRTHLRHEVTAPAMVSSELFPRGDLTFSGVIMRMNPQMLLLRTRSGDEKRILIRDDTRFMDSGLPVSLEKLAVNTRVFVRAGRNFDQDLEAFQVIWGTIAGP